MPGVAEEYAVFSLDYLAAGRKAIDRYFEELGVGVPRLVKLASLSKAL